MTENRCIELLKKMKHIFTETCAKIDENTALDMAVEAIKEIQQYRAIGTVEDIQDIYSLCFTLQEIVNKYSEIGTTEEFKNLKENSFFNFDSLVVRVDKKSYDKAIDEFAERLKSDEFQKYNLDMVFETSRDLSYSHCINSFCEYVDKIAEQMKGGAE